MLRRLKRDRTQQRRPELGPGKTGGAGAALEWQLAESPSERARVPKQTAKHNAVASTRQIRLNRFSLRSRIYQNAILHDIRLSAKGSCAKLVKAPERCAMRWLALPFSEKPPQENKGDYEASGVADHRRGYSRIATFHLLTFWN